MSGAIPESLAAKPEFSGWMAEYFDAFRVLSSRRTCGMAANPITLPDIMVYLQLYGATDYREFVDFIILMDTTYLQYFTDKASA